MGDVADVTGQRPAAHEGRNGCACDFEGLVIGCRPGRLLGRLCAKRCRRSAKRRLCEVLERAGFEVLLVSPRLTKQNSARKSDVPDCQWIWQLHFCSWLGFAPGTRVSDGKALAGRAPKTSPPSANSALHASGGHRRNQTTGATNGKPRVPAGQSWRPVDNPSSGNHAVHRDRTVSGPRLHAAQAYRLRVRLPCPELRPSPRAVRLAGVEGLEPPTPGFGDRCSSQLSYTPAAGAAPSTLSSRAASCQQVYCEPGRPRQSSPSLPARARPFPQCPPKPAYPLSDKRSRRFSIASSCSRSFSISCSLVGGGASSPDGVPSSGGLSRPPSGGVNSCMER